MFSEKHQKILQEIALKYSGRVSSDIILREPESFEMQEIADRVGLSAALVNHLIDELHQYGFVSKLESFRERAEISLLTKGEAAVECPEYFLGKPMNQQDSNNWYGDRVAGDKIGGDKVMGNKVQIGNVQGDAIAGNKIVNTQNLTQAAQDIKDLLNQLAIDYPNDDEFTQAGRAIGAIKKNPTIKQRLGNALKESGTTAVEKAIEAVTDHPAVSIIVAGVKGFIDAEG